MSTGKFDAKAAAESGVTPGNPEALHAFPAHETNLTALHRTHLDELARRIVRSFRQPLTVRRVLIVGHAATFRGISKAEYGRRALARAESARDHLRARLAKSGRDKDVEIRIEHRANDIPLVDNMVHSSSRTAQRNRALNRRVEIQLKRGTSGPYHPLMGSGAIVPPTYLSSEPETPLDLFPILVGSCMGGTRRPVPDSTQVPFRWICAIESIFVDPDNRGKLVTFKHAATGLLISPRHVLTAGHVLVDTIKGSAGTEKLEKAIAVRVIPGMNGHPHNFPFGVVSAQFRSFGGLRVKPRHRGRFRVSEHWRGNKDPGADFGLIELPLVDRKPLGERRVGSGEFGWWGSPDFRRQAVIEPIAKTKLDRRPVTLVGYPLDKQLKGKKVVTFPQWISSGKGRVRGYSQWVDDNFILPGATRDEALQFKSDDIITYDACTLSGNSGSPVWIIDAKKRRNLVAVHTRGVHLAELEPYEFGAGVRLSRSVLMMLRDWERTM